MALFATPMQLVRIRFLHDVVFIHINKTGGSSVEKALGLGFAHLTALQTRRLLGERRWARRFSFAVVRNPWDKISSHYHYRVQTNQTRLKADAISFSDWVKRAYGDRDPKYYDKPLMFAPQVEWLSDEQGNIIVGHIMRFERLQPDFDEVCRIMQREPVTLPRLKPSVRGPYQEDYDDEAREVVAERFERDIETFGYSF
jgi:hypothetical protein